MSTELISDEEFDYIDDDFPIEDDDNDDDNVDDSDDDMKVDEASVPENQNVAATGSNSEAGSEAGSAPEAGSDVEPESAPGTEAGNNTYSNNTDSIIITISKFCVTLSRLS